MKKLETLATSRKTAVCNPIVLRETERVRLVFLPTLVDNTANPKASVDGEFIYQRKAATGRWLPAQSVALSTLKQGEGFHLKLHAQELRTLLEGLVPLYHFYDQQGVPSGKKTFVQVESTLAELVSTGEKDLAAFVESQPDKAAETLVKLVRWLSTSPGSSEVASRLVALAPEQIPPFTALLGLASIKESLAYWEANQSNTSEEFWQKALADRSHVLSQIFAYPIIMIGSKAYVGGKQITNKSGKKWIFWQ